MLRATTGRYHFFGLIAAAMLLAAAAPPPPARRELHLADAMSLRLPAVADALGLSQEQRRRVQKLIEEHSAAFAPLLRKFPGGEQDNEGESIRSRLRRQLSQQMRSVTAELLAVLEPKQRAALLRRGPARFWDGAPAGTVEPFRHWEPPIFDRIGLTQQQRAALPKTLAVKPLSITLDREPTEKERSDLAERIVAWFAQRDRAARDVLTEEQRLIVDEWLKVQRGPKFYLLDRFVVNQALVRRLRPAGGTGTTLTVEGCFAVLRTGEKEPRLLSHPPHRLVNVHAVSPSGKLVATAASTFLDPTESVLRIWEVSTGRLLAEYPSDCVITTVAFVDDRVLVAAMSRLGGRREPGGGLLWTQEEVPTRLKASRELIAGHARGVQAIAFSRDGRYIASADFGHASGTIRLWDAKAQSLVTTIEGAEEHLQSLTFSGDGKLLLAVGWSKVGEVWKVPTGERVVRLAEAKSCVAASPDGRLAATAGPPGTAQLWKLPSGEKGHTLALPAANPDVTALAFSPDGKLLAVGRFDGGRVELWDPAKGKRTGTLRAAVALRDGGPLQIDDLAFHPKGKLLAVASGRHKVEIWDVERSRLVATLSCEGSSLDFSRDGSLLAVGDGAGIKLVNTATWKVRPAPVKDGYALYSVRFSPDGKTVACGRGDAVELWDAASGKLRAQLRPPAGPVRSVAFSPDSRTVAVARGRAVELWGVTGRAGPRRLERRHAGAVQSVAFRAGLLASGCAAGEVWLHDLDQDRGTLLGKHEKWVASVTFALTEDLLASASLDGVIRLWDKANGRWRGLATLRERGGAVRGVAFAPDGKTLAAALLDGSVELWDVGRRARLRAWKAHETLALAVAYTRDGKWLASGGFDGDVRLWHPQTGKPLETLRRHKGAVWALQPGLGPEGLVSAGGDGDALVWDVRRGKAIAEFSQESHAPSYSSGRQSPVVTVAVSGDGKWLAAISWDDAAVVCPVPAGVGK